MRSRAGLLAAIVLATAPRAAGAQVPLGANFQVNSYTTGDQAFPSVACEANGNFVVVWNSVDQDGSGYGIFARRYDAAGDAIDAADFRVNAYTAGSQSSPAVAVNPSGMLVAWHSTVHDGSGHGVYARRFDAAGAPLGAEFRVNTYTTGDQNDTDVAADAGGGFIVVWTSLGQDGSAHGVFGQRFDAAGAPQGGEVRVHSHTPGSQTDAAVAADAAGNFVVVWQSAGQDGDGGGIFAQRFDAAGLPQGGEFRVNDHTTGHQANPSVASDDTGGFAVVWASFGQDGAGDGVFARLYAADGSPLGGEFQVNAYTTGFQGLPSVSADLAGFAVTWTSEVPEDGPSGIVARRYDGSGAPQGSEFRVNTFTAGYQIYSDVAADARGDFVTAWMSEAQDGSLWGVFGQRFAPDVIFADGFE